MAERMLSAVVTCYKDEPAILLMHARLSAVFISLGIAYEIIFVNDGSPDKTDGVLEALTEKDEHVLSIEHSRNFGSQNAFVSGMQIATGDAVILLDGDLQDPPELISEFYSKWQEGYDVVYGRRNKRQGSLLLQFCARAFYKVFRGVSEVQMPLDAGDFALMDRRVVSELLALPETDQFLRGLRAWVGFRQTGVNYLRPERAFGRSTHNFVKNIWWAKKGIFSFSSLPIEGLGYTAALLTTLSLCALGYQGVNFLRHPEASHGTSTIIIVIAFFGSLNLLAVSIVGEYLIKVLEEAKRRPKFIRKAIRQGNKRFTTATEMNSFLQARMNISASRAASSVHNSGVHQPRSDASE